MTGYRLRYRPDTRDGLRFKSIRYPSTWNPACPTREHAEILRQAMPDPDKFEICEDGD